MRKNEGYLLDMLVEARKLSTRFEQSSRSILETDTIRRDAALWSLTVIGEAATKVSKEYRDAHAAVPWREIIGLRNVLVHNYAEVDLDIVWDVIHEAIPKLIPVLERLIPPDPPS